MSASTTNGRNWTTFNPLTQMVETRDGTEVAVELTDNVTCLADALHIAKIRDDQRLEEVPDGRG